MSQILLTTINAKWIHPSLALRLLKANLGELENQCEIIEFALRQPLYEKVDPIITTQPKMLGLSVSIWNHTATLELLRELQNVWNIQGKHPVVVLGGPEVSYLPDTAEIFQYADYVIRGEGEAAFRELCRRILCREIPYKPPIDHHAVNLYSDKVNVNQIKSAYHLYTDEDLRKKLTYIEASRGCPFNCAFCLSAVKTEQTDCAAPVREFPLDPFFADMAELVRQGARTFKFLDRTFNLNINRARRIMEFFLEKIAERQRQEPAAAPFTVHFEMVPSRFPPELMETLARFPPGSLRLEIGIQTLNSEVSRRINRPSNPENELEAIRFLREKTGAIIHADLIAGLPGEDLASFGRGFDLLWNALSVVKEPQPALAVMAQTEIQLGILKLLPGAPIGRYTQVFDMRYSSAPPYEVIETAALSARDIEHIKNFARFWELLVNRGLLEANALARLPDKRQKGGGIFERFMVLSDSLLTRFGQNWGIDKHALREAALQHIRLDIIF